MTESVRQLPATLFYFADPMCSWCWGFSPVISALVGAFPTLPVSLVLGGLRAGNASPTSATFRDEILQHWHEVQRRTGQNFRFEGALPDGFVYDTEPPCRAVVTTIALNRRAALAYFRSVQKAFYVEQANVTAADVLARLASEYGIEEADFRPHFESQAARARTRRHFDFARDVGVHGFPTVVLGDARGYRLLTNGYQPFDALQPQVEEWLAGSPQISTA
jgi:putative protein-disulfide isomerase